MSADKAQVLVARLVSSHGTQLRSYLSRRIRNSADVPDLVQEVYLRMLRVPDHDAIRSPEAYLFTIAHHVARQHAIRQAHIERPTELNEMLAELAEVTNDPAGEISAQQSLQELEQALRHLSVANSNFLPADRANRRVLAACIPSATMLRMRERVVLLIHIIATIAKFLLPGGARSIIAESLLLKHQLLILNRSRARAPNLRPCKRGVSR